MNFVQVASTVFQAFEREGLRYAVIGGFALGFWGVERSTTDIDFLLFIEDDTKADQLLTSYGYHAIYRTDNVAQYESGDSDLGSLDIIFAFREVSTQMLSRSVVFKLTPTVKFRVLVPEDIIGLKLQALCNETHNDFIKITLIYRR